MRLHRRPRVLGSCRISFGDVAPTRCQLLTAQLARPVSRFAGGWYQNFHDGFASIDATKKQNAATPTASIRYPVAAPSPTTTSRKQTNDAGGLRNRSTIKVCASHRRNPTTRGGIGAHRGA